MFLTFDYLAKNDGKTSIVVIKGEGEFETFYELWMRIDETVIGYLKLMENRLFYGDHLVGCDIEIRDGYNGKGYAKQIITEAQEHFGKTIHWSGLFTKKGHKAFAGKVPLLPDASADQVPCSDMTFVRDWDTMAAAFPM